MRRLLALAPSLFAACAASPSDLPVHGETPGHVCEAKGTERFVGRPGNRETGAAIMRATHAAVLRWAPPGAMMTMDYSENRVTVHLGRDGKVTRIRCG